MTNNDFEEQLIINNIHKKVQDEKQVNKDEINK